MALVTAGVGIHEPFRIAASLVLLAAGTFTAAQAWFAWVQRELALRHNTPLPSPRIALPIGIAVAVVGVLVLLGAIIA